MIKFLVIALGIKQARESGTRSQLRETEPSSYLHSTFLTKFMAILG